MKIKMDLLLGDETEELRVPPDEADDEADISEDEGGDGDATNSKEKSRQTQVQLFC